MLKKYISNEKGEAGIIEFIILVLLVASIAVYTLPKLKESTEQRVESSLIHLQSNDTAISE